jgi:hypothetical protein
MTESVYRIRLGGLVLGLFVFGLLFTGACAPRDTRAWYKGNLHTHTTFSDGDTEPEGVIQWYRDHGYNFLAITDHNFLLNIKDYKDRVDDAFILISGNEISDSFDEKPLHFLALGLYDAELKPVGGNGVADTLQNNVTAIRRAGALPILAHPNFRWAFGAEEMIGIKDCVLFEVLNAHPSVNNAGDETRPGTEEMWDQVLSAGKLIYGIGTDDMHKIATYPGKSWIMVRAAELSESAILDAMENGDFYVSTGVVLDEYTITRSAVRIRIRLDGDSLYTTMFIGEGGQVLARSDSLNPVYKKSEDEPYVRAKIVDSNGKVALTQPVFFDK